MRVYTDAFAKATFSAQGPPEKWKTLIPVKTRPSEQSVAHPTVWSVILRSTVPLGTASMTAFAASMREDSDDVRGMLDFFEPKLPLTLLQVTTQNIPVYIDTFGLKSCDSFLIHSHPEYVITSVKQRLRPESFPGGSCINPTFHKRKKSIFPSFRTTCTVWYTVQRQPR